MAQTRRSDYYEELERIERRLDPLMAAEQAAFRRLIATSSTAPEKSRLLAEYWGAVKAADEVRSQRQEFREQFTP